MPFRKWQVEPVFLSRKPLPPDKPIFETTTNGTLVKCMEQMACILSLADRIFDEIGAECRLVLERTEKLKLKVQLCVDAVAKLDAKAVPVPISDLENTVCLLRQPQYVTHYDQTNQMFLPSTRPPSVDELYGRASATPVPLISAIDRYRSDGCKGSQLFMVTPILGDAERRKRKHRKMLDIETRRPASFALAKDWQEDGENGTLLSGSGQAVASSSTLQQRIKEDGLERLPSPEELVLAASLEYPSSVVPVDTTGSSFLRMIKSRRSLIHVDFIIRRKKSKKKTKRRHTVCEGSSKELEDALRNISVTDTSCQTDELPEVGSLSSSFRRSFLRRRGRATVDNVLRETDRLNVNVDGQKKGGKASSPAVEDDKDLSTNKENTLNSKKSTKLSLKSRNFINPISSLSAALSIAVKMRHASRTAGKQDDGRSSSGNWSASSSTRASVDSDQHRVITPVVDCTSSVSRNSVGKDSVLSDATQMDTIIRIQDGVSVSPKNLPLSKSCLINQSEGKKDNELWSIEVDQGRQSSTSTPERASDSTNTSVALSPYLLRKGAPPNLPVTGNLDDGESSVYSVDTDGYYTSMHTDSGLWNAVAQSFKLGDSVASESFKFRRRQESQSSVSTIGNSSINSFLSRTATEVSSNQSSLKRQKPAPQPPPRSSSASQTPQENRPMLQSEIVKESEIDGSEKSSSPMPFPNGSTSESDYESRDRIQLKTKINSSRYPSMCAVSPETSDDEALETSSFREKAKSPVINVVVAEVHREENPSDVQSGKISSPVNSDGPHILGSLNIVDTSQDHTPPGKIPASSSQSPIINMYGSHSPVQSSFSSSLVKVKNDFLHSSPINTKYPVSTFFPDTSEIKIGSESYDSFSSKAALPFLPEQGSQNSGKVLCDSLAPHHKISGSPKHSAVPLKYTPCITVTPIARIKTDHPVDRVPGTNNNLPQPHSYSSHKITANPAHFSYDRSLSCRNSSISQSPGPLNISDSVNPAFLQRNYSCSSVQAARPVARVTLDPTGKVVYASRSLDRRTNDGFQNQKFSAKCNSKPVYATLPLYQGHSSSSSLEKNEHNGNQSSSKTDAIGLDQQQVKESETQNSDFPLAKSVFSHSVEQENNPVCQTQKFDDSSSFHQYPEAFSSTKARDLYFRPSRGGRFCRTYFPPHLISSPAPSSKEPQTMQQTTSLRSFKTEFSQFQDPALYGSDLSRSHVANTTFDKSNILPPSQYLNRTNNNGGFPENMRNFSPALPENTVQKNHQNRCATSFSTRNYFHPSHLMSNPRSVHETHFRPLNPAAPALQCSLGSNSYVPRTYTSFDAQRKVNSANYLDAVRPAETVHNFLSASRKDSYALSGYQEKPAVPFLGEDDSSSQYSSLSFDSGDASEESGKPCSSHLLSQPPDVIPSSASPRSTLDITSPSTSNLPVQESKLQKSINDDKTFPAHTAKQSTPVKSLSANELFAIIHSSKKKHNIKTESEKSLSPLSSRSSSPGAGLTPVKGIHVETGVLGRRNGSHLKPGDRHSWDGNQSSVPEKKSLAQDRLGRTKPTSMHDFKMLLLQARSGSNDSGPRPSAAELLKVSPQQNLNPSSVNSPSRSLTSSPSRSLTSSPVKTMSLTKPQSPILSHSTLPLKRTVRTRSPYLTRYDSAYPPILEDCSEESESVSDNYPTTTSHLISPAQSNSKSLEGCDRHHFSCDSDQVHESSKPNSKITSTWV